MAVTVNVASTSYKLTTRTRVLAELGLSSSEVSTGYIEDFIDAASDAIVSFTGRKFAQETVTETFESRGSEILITDRTPIVSIAYVQLDGSSVSSTAYSIDDADAGFIYKQSRWTNTAQYNEYLTLHPRRHGRRDWAVKYVAGYVLPNSTATQTLPYDVEKAAIELAKTMYLTGSKDPTLFSEKTGDASETKYPISGAGGASLPPTVLALLKPYVRLTY